MGSGRGERGAAVLGDPQAGIGDPPLEGSGSRPGLAMEDEDDDIGHRRSLPSGSPSLTGRPRSRRVRAYVGLGANVGDAEATIAGGVRALAALPGARLRAVSRLYATAPVGVVDQPEFRNAVAALDIPAGPDPETGAVALLVALKQLEAAFGRQERDRWGPRELDLDLLVFGRQRIAVERPAAARSRDPAKPTDLVVPHRLAGERLFVLAPLADLAPGLVPPGWRETVESARRRRAAVEGPAAVRPVARWSDDRWLALDPDSSPQPR
jgi:2-amino-4-hydroxy-6-hydroxymethyldihydropteridine diphosphokinase